jgi:chromosome segregation ATPase
MNRPLAILTAATLTGLVLMTIAGLGIGNLRAAADKPSGEAPASATPDVGSYKESLLERRRQLEELLRTMQTNEDSYAAQVEEANRTIQTLNETLAQLESETLANDATIAQHEAAFGAASSSADRLRRSIAGMQAREPQYLAQIQAATQTITELQAYIDQYNAQQAAAAAATGSSGGSHYDDEYEDAYDD